MEGNGPGGDFVEGGVDVDSVGVVVANAAVFPVTGLGLEGQGDLDALYGVAKASGGGPVEV